MKLLNYIIEPKKLLIAWQHLQEGKSSGKRYIVGELKKVENNVELHYFNQTEDFEKALKFGFSGFSIFSKDEKKHLSNIMEVLSRRVPSTQRSDFDDFLRYYRINPECKNEISEFALLGYTGAKLPGDGFSFIHTFENATVPCEIVIKVAGARYYCEELKNLEDLKDISVFFEAETDNEDDPDAIVIKTKDSKKIGYVNRGQTKIFKKWIENKNSIEAHIERINGALDRPNLLLYVKIT